MRTAVVLTYPGHFLLTKVCLQSLKHISDLTNIKVIADDLSLHAWTNYIEDCENLYNVEVIPTSGNKILRSWKDNPWIRQQMVKFYLDSFVEHDVFFTDGDCKFFTDVPRYCTPYTITKYSGVPLSERDPLPGEVTSQQQNYVDTFLHNHYPPLDDPKKIVRRGRTVGTSGCPFRDIKLDVVKELRDYVETVFHNANGTFKNFSELHQHHQYNTTLSISEWEIYERFRKHILQQELEMVFYPPHSQHDKSTHPSNGDFFATCFECDFDMGIEWFLQEKVPQAENYWDIVPHTK